MDLCRETDTAYVGVDARSLRHDCNGPCCRCRTATRRDSKLRSLRRWRRRHARGNSVFLGNFLAISTSEVTVNSLRFGEGIPQGYKDAWYEPT